MVKNLIEETVWHISGMAIPVKICREKRQNARCSIGKTHLLVRLPRTNAAVEATLTAALQKEAEKWFAPNSPHRHRYAPKTYPPQYVLTVGHFSYQIEIKTGKSAGFKAKWQAPHTILIEQPMDVTATEAAQHIATLLSRVVAKHQAPSFTARVRELNTLFFQKDIESIQFQYNFSNWGSCSARRRLKFSSRLLFAPPDVQDYVIIHELAHLIEMNHSDRFWQLVRRAMPDFEAKERWLKENGPSCYF